MIKALKTRAAPRTRVFFDMQDNDRVVERKYTYEDMLEWPEDTLTELFSGRIINMPPASITHHRISRKLTVIIDNFLSENPGGEVFVEAGVRLAPLPDNSDTTVLIPDLIVVKDPDKLDDQACNGAPDLVIEILSPASIKYDSIQKRDKYEEAGVPEYWLVDPKHDKVTVHLLVDGHYLSTEYGAADSLPVMVLPGCVVNLREVFG